MGMMCVWCVCVCMMGMMCVCVCQKGLPFWHVSFSLLPHRSKSLSQIAHSGSTDKLPRGANKGRERETERERERASDATVFLFSSFLISSLSLSLSLPLLLLFPAPPGLPCHWLGEKQRAGIWAAATATRAKRRAARIILQREKRKRERENDRKGKLRVLEETKIQSSVNWIPIEKNKDPVLRKWNPTVRRQKANWNLTGCSCLLISFYPYLIDIHL